MLLTQFYNTNEEISLMWGLLRSLWVSLSRDGQNFYENFDILTSHPLKISIEAFFSSPYIKSPYFFLFLKKDLKLRLNSTTTPCMQVIRAKGIKIKFNMLLLILLTCSERAKESMSDKIPTYIA